MAAGALGAFGARPFGEDRRIHPHLHAGIKRLGQGGFAMPTDRLSALCDRPVSRREGPPRAGTRRRIRRLRRDAAESRRPDRFVVLLRPSRFSAAIAGAARSRMRQLPRVLRVLRVDPILERGLCE